MRVCKLTAKRNLGKIPKGFVLQVAIAGLTPSQVEVEKAIITAGFSDNSSRNSGKFQSGWIIEKL